MFEWDEHKNQQNIIKHNVSFETAVEVFTDANRITLMDEAHSNTEDRYFCIGKVAGDISTIRFVIRNNRIRIIGAGYWRSGRKRYENRD